MIHLLILVTYFHFRNQNWRVDRPLKIHEYLILFLLLWEHLVSQGDRLNPEFWTIRVIQVDLI